MPPLPLGLCFCCRSGFCLPPPLSLPLPATAAAARRRASRSIFQKTISIQPDFQK
ncbi:hypothetical protein [Methanimicrococcus hongohii]|uniref:hypothetical protein n=1 Tax=Methanimicrococcus hongohii TaxID=3028295 RepID=UPI00292F8AEC|nr:hypothetical protein [Methanimicrococcus sp. Hf6]